MYAEQKFLQQRRYACTPEMKANGGLGEGGKLFFSELRPNRGGYDT